jgi:hypothetical protein
MYYGYYINDFIEHQNEIAIVSDDDHGPRITDSDCAFLTHFWPCELSTFGPFWMPWYKNMSSAKHLYFNFRGNIYELDVTIKHIISTSPLFTFSLKPEKDTGVIKYTLLAWFLHWFPGPAVSTALLGYAYLSSRSGGGINHVIWKYLAIFWVMYTIIRIKPQALIIHIMSQVHALIQALELQPSAQHTIIAIIAYCFVVAL